MHPPICPVQARYHRRSLPAAGDEGEPGVQPQAVASRIHVDPASGEVDAIEYQRYEDRHPVGIRSTRRGGPRIRARRARGRTPSSCSPRARQLQGPARQEPDGPPVLYAWGSSPQPIGPLRGPPSTAGMDDLRGGASGRSTRHSASTSAMTAGGRPRAPRTPPSPRRSAPEPGGRGAAPPPGRHAVAPGPLLTGGRAAPSTANRVTIDPRHVDQLGNPRPVIDYQHRRVHPGRHGGRP